MSSRSLTENISEHSSEPESREELPDRWLFNLAVFFLLLPFTVLVSYMIGSLIGVGFGVALVAWRVAVTPEITNHISPKIRGRTRPTSPGPIHWSRSWVHAPGRERFCYTDYHLEC